MFIPLVGMLGSNGMFLQLKVWRHHEAGVDEEDEPRRAPAAALSLWHIKTLRKCRKSRWGSASVVDSVCFS